MFLKSNDNQMAILRGIYKKNVCPICNGEGKIEAPYKTKMDIIEMKRKCAVLLQKEGYSYRQIMNFLKYKSPRSVSHLFEQSKKRYGKEQ